MKKEDENPIYAHDTLEFVTVAVQFCAYLEKSQGLEKRKFTATMLKLLPLLYLKAQLLPKVESNGAFLPADHVTEDDYNFLRKTIFEIMQKDDDYEDLVWDEDMQTEETKWKSISEGIADIYQAVRNFVSVYQQRIEDCMNDALWAIEDNFELYWGQNLVDTMRQLHKIHYSLNYADYEDDLQ